MLCLAVAPAAAEMVTLSGEVTYRERAALPEGATLRIRLIDTTAPGTPVRVEVAAPIPSPGQVPLAFSLNFDDRAIDPDHEHAIVAEITAGEQVRFRNAAPYPLDPLATAGPLLVVTSFVSQPAGEEAAATPTATVPDGLLETTWRAERIGSDPALPGIDSTLTISRDMRAGGRGGCNSYFAQVAISGETVRFSAIAATRMACLSTTAMTQETAFFVALGAAQRWRIEDDRLLLLDEGGNELVRFSRSVR
jgi:putative lipoprotein